MRKTAFIILFVTLLSGWSTGPVLAASAKGCELALGERPRARMMRRPAVELRTFNSLPRVADAAGALRYAPTVAAGESLEAQDRVALETALQRLESPRRMIVAVCHGDPETDKTAPALGSCDSHYYLSADGHWERLAGKPAPSLARLASVAADAPTRSHYQLLRAIVACADNQVEQAIELFEAATVASDEGATRFARAVSNHALVESAMLQMRQIVGTRRKLGRKQLDRLTTMLGEHSRQRCAVIGEGAPFQIYAGNSVSVPVARGYNKGGYVRLGFDVDERGVPANISIIDQEPASGLYGKASTTTLKSARYMAGCQEGQPYRVSGHLETMNWGITQTGSPQVLFSP